ncbi:MAG: T9SS type A sorting domain-containing protein, partial [Ignavibacteriae bacterium]|nr:T9SS type A sorting domain-containing protein [Ignavibacteriota bacterium]
HSSKYNSPISIETSKVVKAIFIEDGKLPSQIITKSFFINEEIDLPIISISTEPKNLWDDKIGIYTIGTNGIERWEVNANYWQEWERPAHFEYFNESKQKVVNQGIAIAINGARRNMLHKSMRIFARAEYGSKQIDYKFFSEKDISEFSSLVLRNGGYPEFRFTLFADGFIQNLLADEMDIDYQAYQPTILFMNGEYWGIYNIREKQNEEYIASNHNVDKNNLDILEYNMGVIEGDKNHYSHLLNFIDQNDLQEPSNYDSIKSWIDINEYINYQISQIYMANLDWPANNIKKWRPRTKDGKWRWLLFDVDFGFGLSGKYDHNTIEFATEPDSEEWNNKPWSTYLLRNLLVNSDFKNSFLQRFALFISYSFNPERVNAYIDNFQNRIRKEIPYHINRWAIGCSPGNPESKDGCTFDTIDKWEEAINVRREFANLRPKFMRKHLMEYFSVADTNEIIVNSEGELGEIYLNNVKVRLGQEATIFSGINLELVAIPKVGYKFTRWEGDIYSNDDNLKIVVENDLNISALFEPIDDNQVPSIVNSNYELRNENSPYYANGDIFVKKDAVLFIQEGVEIIMPSESGFYIEGGLHAIGTKEEPIIIKTDDQENNKWGAICFENTTDKYNLYHVKLFGTTNGQDTLNQFGGISSVNSDLDINYLEMRDGNFPIFIQGGSLILRNSIISTSVVSDLVNVKNGDAIIENCEFIGNNSIDTDAIDYDDVKDGVIRNNYIHDFIGDNSDAIDLGEGSSDIIVEGNFIINCFDKGISIGQESNAIIRNNIIVDCDQGIGIKDEFSYASIENNTFYKNDIAVACFEKSPGNGGGKADIRNSIFSQSKSSSIFYDQFSEINVSYSLSDTELLSGEKNIFGNPLFLFSDSLDFRISSESLCIDSGDPNSANDADGSRANIGAYAKLLDENSKVVINEINYNSSDDFNPKDWIEIYNPTDQIIDVSNWIFKDSNEEHIFVFPLSTNILPYDYLVLCEDVVRFNEKFPNVNKIIGDFEFGLNNSGEHIRLFDNYGNLIDSLTYDDEKNWPVEPDGNGSTLQLISDELDNSKVESWKISKGYGTPTTENIFLTDTISIQNIPSEFMLYQNYPNPFNPSTIISYSIPQLENKLIVSVKIRVFDILGREVITLVEKELKSGSYNVRFDAKGVSSGIYYAQMVAGDYLKTIKMLLLK